uniref:Uncharacterized protein n=1 Tax=Physcomitrium patens TaxID=3218 RepID=A0A2K1K8G5_PHYPA|nr:hypothetical protein PHYPA_011958 [Physcomitrium patens]
MGHRKPDILKYEKYRATNKIIEDRVADDTNTTRHPVELELRNYSGSIAQDQFTLLKQKANPDNLNLTWEFVLHGNMHRPTPQYQQDQPSDDYSWDAGSPCSLSKHIPKDILRWAMLWYIWYQRCKHDLRNGQFPIGVLLY